MQDLHVRRLLAVTLLFGLAVGLSHGGVSNASAVKRLLELLEKRATWPSSCTDKYPKTSTMCAYPDSPNILERGVSQQSKDTIVNVHNGHRSNVSPPATNMAKMYWDEEIAKIAQKWTDTCPNGGHDTNKNRKVPGYGMGIGQNWAKGYSSWTSVINGWHSEVSVYTYGVEPYNFAAVGHYTQVVRDLAIRIGCGYTRCSSGRYYVCNYAHGNAYNVGFPYESGSSCSKCLNKCTNNLCDCKGMLCKNGGTLNQNTCTCTCKGVWSGTLCDTCPAADSPQCSRYTTSWCKYSNIKPMCPYMCGVCTTGSSNNGNTPSPAPTPAPAPAPAPTGGNNGDNSERCPGKTGSCKNGGTLQDDCTCSCTSKWTGDACQYMANCPSSDPYPCGGYFKKRHCRYSVVYVNSKPTRARDCPNLCGFCSP